MNIVMASFKTVRGQMTKMSQWKKKPRFDYTNHWFSSILYYNGATLKLGFKAFKIKKLTL